MATSCLASPHLFVAHKIVLCSFDESFTLSKGGTDKRRGVSKEGLNVLEFFIVHGERLEMGEKVVLAMVLVLQGVEGGKSEC